MIVTHTQNAAGQRRVYLGGKSSLECWITPHDDGKGWRWNADHAVSGNPLSADDARAWVNFMINQLAEAVGVAPNDLPTVPFEVIAALHTANPFDGRRIAAPRRNALDQGFMATVPGITRPRAESASEGRPRWKQR